MHGIIFTDNWQDIEKIWGYGYVWSGKIVNGRRINYVSERTINYITKYVTKVDLMHKYYRPVILCSPGIGANYTKSKDFERNKYKGKETKETYTNRQGYKMSLPIYWRNKAYTEEEREQLWLQRLDKNERWVKGEKVAASNYEEYIKMLKYHRRNDNETGYGSPKNWEAKKYENERRMLKQNERLRPKRKGG